MSVAFHFSRDLLSSVRHASRSSGSNSSSGSSLSELRAVSPNLAQSESQLVRNPNTSSICSAPSREAIIYFLERIADSTGDKMPGNDERHLPFYLKNEVYSHFKEDFKKIHLNSPVPSMNYFFRTWKHYCRNIKVRKSNRFSKCDICEQLKDEIKPTVMRFDSTQHLLQQKRIHFKMIADERLEYKKKRDKAIICLLYTSDAADD